MSSKVVLRKNGGFYSVYGDDAYILYYLLNYKIFGGFCLLNKKKKTRDSCLTFVLLS